VPRHPVHLNDPRGPFSSNFCLAAANGTDLKREMSFKWVVPEGGTKSNCAEQDKNRYSVLEAVQRAAKI
jgi:hypothetical protein